MTSNVNSAFLTALARQRADHTPIWIMRQAGRYLPEYRAVRANFPQFMDMCKTPEAACEVTLQPLARFDLDAAIIFSDILTIPGAMGLGLRFAKNEGPVFDNPVRTVEQIQALQAPDVDNQLHYVFDAIALTVKELAGKVPLIGFAGSPWTIATYMVEGGSSKTYSNLKKLLYTEPQAAHHLLNLLTQTTITYLQAQIDAGVQAVQIFDTWGSVLTPREYDAFSLDYMRKIVAALKKSHPKTPVILFTKGAGLNLSAMADSGCDALGVDWSINLSEARRLTQGKVALQGNMDPCVLYADASTIRAEVKNILQQFDDQPGHVFNLGHGIYPDVPPENVQVLVEAVHEFSLETSC